MVIGDIEKMIAVGLIWGATNALMRKGAIIWDQKSLKSSRSNQTPPLHLHNRIIRSLQNYLNLILTWQYSVPFFLNLSASASFFAVLGHAPISLAVPVTNATTFAATALMGMLLGERTRIGGSFLIHGVMEYSGEFLSDDYKSTRMADCHNNPMTSEAVKH